VPAPVLNIVLGQVHASHGEGHLPQHDAGVGISLAALPGHTLHYPRVYILQLGVVSAFCRLEQAIVGAGR
jgi:hypothetical protein